MYSFGTPAHSGFSFGAPPDSDVIVSCVQYKTEDSELLSLLPSQHVNKLHTTWGWTPLNYAILHSKRHYVEILLKQDNIDVEAKNGEMPFLDHSQYRYKTPLEIAKIIGDEEIIAMITRAVEEERWRPTKEVTHEVQEERRKQIKDINSTAIKGVKAIVQEEPVESVSNLMSNGTLEAGMWDEVVGVCERKLICRKELQTKLSEKKDQHLQIVEQLRILREQKRKVDKEIKKLELDIEQQPGDDALEVINMLVEAESNNFAKFNRNFKQTGESDEEISFDLGDVGFFLNVTGMARISKKLAASMENDTSEKLLLPAIASYMESEVPLGEFLDIECATDIVMKKQTLKGEFDKHVEKCPVCRMSIPELLEEYQITDIDATKFAEHHVKSTGISYLRFSHLKQYFGLTTIQAVKMSRVFRTMNQTHHTNI